MLWINISKCCFILLWNGKWEWFCHCSFNVVNLIILIMKITISLKPIFSHGAQEHFLTTNICEKIWRTKYGNHYNSQYPRRRAPWDVCRWRGTVLWHTKARRKQKSEKFCRMLLYRKALSTLRISQVFFTWTSCRISVTHHFAEKHCGQVGDLLYSNIFPICLLLNLSLLPLSISPVMY